MAYIGREPQIGNFQVCDAITTVNNQAAYTMQVGGVNVSPETANHMLVSLNGILQAPTTSYTVAGSTITFASNLVTGDVINFIQILGSVLDLGVPSDDTVSLAKLTATGTQDVTTFLRGDNTFAEVDRGIVQFKNTTKLDGFSTSSSSPVDVTGLSVNITPSSASNKILVQCNANLSADAQSGGLLYLKIVRVIGGTTTQLNESDSTDTYVHAHAEIEANTAYGYIGSIPLNLLILDDPQTTSQCTYKLQAFTNGSNTAVIGRSGRSPGNTSDIQHATNIMAMELDGGIL
jgi:hypothetical protein